MKLKKVLALTLAIAMVLGTMGTVAFAEKADDDVAYIAGDGVYVKDLQSAFTADDNPNGKQVLMADNWTGDVEINYHDFASSFYLNGYTLEGQLKLTDLSILNFYGIEPGNDWAGNYSKIVAPDNTIYQTSGANVNINGAMTIEATAENGVAIYATAGKVNISKGDIIVNGGIKSVGEAKVSIAAGTFNGTLEAEKSSNLEIIGGKFSVDPSGYLPAGYKAELGEDDMYEVVAPIVSIEYFTQDENGNYLIQSADDVAKFRELLNVPAETGKIILDGTNFILAQNVDMKGYELKTAGNDTIRFAGTFNGQNNKISNMTIDGENASYVAFFGNIYESEISNLTLENITVNGTGEYTAGLVGFARSSTITNCHVIGDIAIAGGSQTGGMVGGGVCDVTRSTIIGNEGSTISGSIDVAGLIGLVSEGTTTIQGNTVSGIAITAERGMVGGIAGRAIAGVNGLSVTGNTINECAVESTNPTEYAGLSGLAIGATQASAGEAVYDRNTITDTTLTEKGASKNTVYCTTNWNGDNYSERVNTEVTSQASVNGTGYESLALAYDAADSGDTITLLSPVTLTEEDAITLDKSVKLNGEALTTGGFLTIANGVSLAGDNITGTVYAEKNATVNVNIPNADLVSIGDITFSGDNVVNSFNTKSYYTTINIGVDVTLAINGTGRMAMGYGNTYNITGNIENAKEADISGLTPSLYVYNGASISGGSGVNFNVTNAYIYFDGHNDSVTSKDTAADGTFNFNITNSVAKFEKKLQFNPPRAGYDLNPAFNFNLKDSVLTTGSHLVFNSPNCNTVIDNSNVNLGKTQQLENYGTLTIQNGADVNAAVAYSQNAANPGTVIVDNATYTATGDFTKPKDVTEITGKLILKNNAVANMDTITDSAAVIVDASSCLTAKKITNTPVELSFDKVAHKKVLDLDETASREGNITLPAKLPDGVELEYGTDGDVTVWPYVAEVGDTKYLDIKDALKAIYDNRNAEGYNNTLNILADETIDAYWDSRNSGKTACYATFTKPIKINGNGHTIKFTNTVYDAGNYMSAFRFEDAAEINGLTIDMSEALSGWGQRIRAISTKAGNLKIDGCTFNGNPDYNQTRAIIFGELGGDKNNADTLSKLAAAGIEIKNSKFVDWSYGITDNENGNDVKTVTISGNEFEDANVQVSASETVAFTGNEMDNSGVTIVSYADVNELTVVAEENTLDADEVNYIKAAEITADEGFKLPVADINGKKYISLQEAVNKAVDGDTIVVTSDISDEKVTVDGDVTITGAAPVATFALTSGNDITLTNVIFDVKKDASLSLDAVAVRGLSYIDANEPESISVTNCDIDVTTKSAGSGCPPAFINFSASNNGAVALTFTDNNLKVTSANSATHGIAGWNSIKSATITGNTFGSEAAPLSNAAVKLMNFVEGATVTVNNNNFYVNSKDAGYAPNAIQLFQNNSRGNNYKAVISANNFYVDDATAAIGINENAMGNPDAYPGNGQVAIGKDNTVNGRAIAIADILVFGNGIADIGHQDYVGLGVEYDENGKITAGTFSAYSAGLNEFLADGYVAVKNAVSGWLEVGNEDAFANSIAVKFVKADVDDAGVDTLEGADEYNIVLEATNDIHEFASAELTFANASKLLNGNDMPYVIEAADNMTLSTKQGKPGYYGFSMEGDKEYQVSGKTITLGKVTFTGYGTVGFNVVSGKVNATTVMNNLVKTFEVGGAVSGDVTKGELVINTGKIDGVTIAVPVRDLAINIKFPNAVENQSKAYQEMKVVISGGDLKENIEIKLGSDWTATGLEIAGKTKAAAAVKYENNAYVINVNDALTVNNAYTVTVSGAGYRTARYTVTMTKDKTLNFWNNVMDKDTVVEEGELSETKNFLAGDIVKDNNINIYDLSAVVSYFGTQTIDAQENILESDYAKYDLNRDGVIDSRDVAYVLVSWGE